MSRAVGWLNRLDRVERKRRAHVLGALLPGWLAIVFVLVLAPCCETFAAAPHSHGDGPVPPQEHSDHDNAPGPCGHWLGYSLDLEVQPALLSGPSKIYAYVSDMPVWASAAEAGSAFIDSLARGVDPPRLLYLELLRLLI